MNTLLKRSPGVSWRLCDLRTGCDLIRVDPIRPPLKRIRRKRYTSALFIGPITPPVQRDARRPQAATGVQKKSLVRNFLVRPPERSQHRNGSGWLLANHGAQGVAWTHLEH